MRLILFEPRYPYGKPRVYLSGGLMNLGSRLMEAGIGVSFFDLNLINLDSKEVVYTLNVADVVGFSIIGPPYIPIVIENIKSLRGKSFNQPIFIGGQGVARVRRSDFACWFKNLGEIVQIQEDSDMFPVFQITHVRSAYETSMVPMLRRLREEYRNRYLEGEFSLFTSNGCKYSCQFCAAEKGRAERYRTIESLSDEVTYICSCLAGNGRTLLKIYLTNLDGFQNPRDFETHLKIVFEIAQKHGIHVEARCLATSKCTAEACLRDSALAYRLRSYGLRVVGFGADGADEETWKRQKKTHNTTSNLSLARTIMQEAGMTVEMLVVLGFQGDRFVSLMRTFLFSLRTTMVQGCILRPYLAKSKTPSAGEMRWLQEDPEVRTFLNDPELLMRLDYAMIGSQETHPSRRERWIANAIYLSLAALLVPLGKCVTYPLFPVPRQGMWRGIAQFVNRRMPFDK